jgi:hypothetical protein
MFFTTRIWFVCFEDMIHWPTIHDPLPYIKYRVLTIDRQSRAYDR